MQINCPHCGQIFDLSSDMADHIRSQIRTEEFNNELESRVSLVRDKMNAEFKSEMINKFSEERAKYDDELKSSEKKIMALESELKNKDIEMSLAVREKETFVRDEYMAIISDLQNDKRSLEHERDYYKDMKSRMSTKMIGETLEQHCELEFEKIRMAAFPNAEFGKDNVISGESKSKGDYIFRECDNNDVEIVSIMFEMKNDIDTTATRHKNKDFLKELDKDRREKNCEYAVLVSLLEPDNDLYNQGIVDMSYIYPKMYVVRPQFFIPVITLLRNAALNAYDDRKELAKIKQQDLDITRFRDNFDAFRKGFGYNYVQAHKRLDEAVNEIDKAISRLQAVRDSLTSSDKQISQAEKKVESMTVEKLCSKSPSLLKELEDGADL